MDATDYAALLRAIATGRAQLALLPLNDPRRDLLYRDLLWCYHEALALLYRRIEALREKRPTFASVPNSETP